MEVAKLTSHHIKREAEAKVPFSPFASKTLREHLLRGAAGIVAFVAAFRIAFTHPMLALVLAVVTVLFFRGCPVCWTTGLIDTAHTAWKSRRERQPAE